MLQRSLTRSYVVLIHLILTLWDLVLPLKVLLSLFLINQRWEIPRTSRMIIICVVRVQSILQIFNMTPARQALLLVDA